jgi:hypothetical protein
LISQKQENPEINFIFSLPYLWLGGGEDGRAKQRQSELNLCNAFALINGVECTLPPKESFGPATPPFGGWPTLLYTKEGKKAYEFAPRKKNWV